MAVEYQIENGYLRVVLVGSFDSADLKAMAESIRQDPAFKADLNLLVDNRPSTMVAGPDDVRERVEYLATVREYLGPRVAVLVDTTVHYGLARMANLLGDSRQLNIEVFTDEDEAIGWLATGTLPNRVD